MLCITVRFLQRRYHGVEYPPSPMRLFSALVAGGHTGRWRAAWADFQPAVEWLERQPAPAIRCAPAQRGKAFTRFVPSNDSDHLGSVTEVGAIRIGKRVQPWLATGDAMIVSYEWPDDPPREIRWRLEALVATVTHVGWGVDLAMASLAPSPREEQRELWTPHVTARSGTFLRVPVPGSFSRLEDEWQRRRRLTMMLTSDNELRIDAYRRVVYVQAGQPPKAVRSAAYRLVESNGRTSAWPITWQLDVAAWVRHAVGAAVSRNGADEGWVRGHIMGHGVVPLGARLAFLPLPSTGHGDGRIRRVLLAPLDSDDESGGELLAATHGLSGCPLEAERSGTVGYLGEEIGNADSVLPRYVREAREWVTVSPIILPEYGSVASGLRAALSHAGVDPNEVEDWAWSLSPMIPQAARSGDYHVANYMRRPRYHVWLRFRHLMTGPMVFGVGRYYGLGLMTGLK